MMKLSRFPYLVISAIANGAFAVVAFQAFLSIEVVINLLPADSFADIYNLYDCACETERGWLMYQQGSQHMLFAITVVASIAVQLWAGACRFRDIGHSGYLALLLLLPFSFVLWIYLIIIPGKPSDKKPGGDGDGSKPSGPVMPGVTINKTSQTIIA